MEVSPSLRRTSLDENVCENRQNTLERVRNLKRRATEKLAELDHYTFTEDSNRISVTKRIRTDKNELDAYIQRIKTFTLSKWCDKPLELHARFVAEHGWICSGKNHLKCSSCARIIATDLPKITGVNVQVYNKCLRNVRDRVINAHELTCAHRTPVIDYFMDFTSSSMIKNKLLKYFESLKDVNLGCVEISSNYDSWNQLSDFFGPMNADADANKRAIIAINLWRGEENKATKQYDLHCELCSRTVSLSCAPNPLDPSSQHFKWCPVLDIQNDGKPAWEHYFAVINKKPKRLSLDIQIAKNTFARSISTNTVHVEEL